MNLVATLMALAIEAQLKRAEEIVKALRGGGGNAEELSDLLATLVRLRNQHADLQGLRRQQYEARFGEIMGQAASVGIDLKLPP